MKSTFALLAAAASLEQVSATFGGISLNHALKGFLGAGSYTCPGNTDNKCIEVQIPGFDWNDLPIGNVGKYRGCDFQGWSCGSRRSRRSYPLSGRTEDDDRFISGESGSEDDEDENPSISAGLDIGGFSIESYHVTSEFDARLEFHYDMPDGSKCKHSSNCSSKGTTIRNSQCGGAKKVKVVYPKHKEQKKKRCGIKIHTIKFDCDKHKTTSTVRSAPPTSRVVQPTTTPKPQSTTSIRSQVTSSQPPASHSTYITTFDTTSTVFTTSVQTITSCAPTVPNCPVKSGSTHIVTVTIPVSTTICPVTETRTHTPSVQTSVAPVTTQRPSSSFEPSKPASSSVVESSKPASSGAASSSEPSKPASSVVESSKPASSIQTQPATSEHVTTVVTTFIGTSTVFTTSVQTITSCAPTVTNCPVKSGSTAVVTVTIPVSTTICPITETQTHTKPVSTPVPTSIAQTLPPTKTEKGVETTLSTVSQPQQSLPCPTVVPKCLNTWLTIKKECKDNMDAACYCTSKDFTDKVFSCLYAFGGSGDVISEAVSFFQGICAPWINKNPAIATGGHSVTAIITVTGTPVTSVALTTVVVATTVTEPCVTQGSTIVGSSTVRVISTQVTVPQITVPPVPVATQPGQPENTQPAPAITTLSPPLGTGNIPGVSTTGSPQVVTAGAAQTGLGLGLAIMAVVLAL